MGLFLSEFSEELRLNTIEKKKTFFRISLYFLKSGLRNFLMGKMDKLDPHAGEAACQTRACYFLYLSLKLKDPFYQEIFIDDLFKQPHPNFSLKMESVFLILSRFLTVFKVPDDIGGYKTIDTKKISLKFKLSREYARRITEFSQRLLAKLSCEFMLKLAKEINYPHTTALETLLMEDELKRKVLPCFFTMDLLLTFVQTKKISLFIEIRSPQESASLIHGLFLSKNPPLSLSLKIIFWGKESDLFKLSQHFYEICYRYISTHPQYPGKKLQAFKENPFKNLSENDLASAKRFFLSFKGFSEKDPKIFHVSLIHTSLYPPRIKVLPYFEKMLCHKTSILK